MEEVDTMPPPPEKNYDSTEECLKDIQEWALNHHYAIVTESSYYVNAASEPGKKEACVISPCDKSGDYWPHHSIVANHPDTPKEPCPATSKNGNKSRKNACPLKIVLSQDVAISKWFTIVKKPNHNHGPSDNPSAHLVHRKFTAAQAAEIKKLNMAGVMPLKIKNSLMKDHKNVVCAPHKAIHNLIYKKRKENLPLVPQSTV
ncbi:hypothetical protein PSHT_13942 [Puccinia striiformis]|uniref:FAR1 domain-containing protein n=1 Tax=Puccinia striiformis TaxID=27350 RepID=A0A2S4UN18_9BASI|nr:hypothetical protein PSHT_13942 [Puccinia striiformis]